MVKSSLDSAKNKGHQVTRSNDPAVKRSLNPVIILLIVLIVAVAMTYVIQSGAYQRKGKTIIPDTYHTLKKSGSALNLVEITGGEGYEAKPVSLIDAFMAIPQAIEQRASMIFMVLFIGGMFGVLNRAGAVAAGLERMLAATRGNIYVLVPAMMIVFSAGSTFMGMATEYLLLIPLVVALANRMNMSNLIGVAIVTIAVKIGYLASITNPYALSIAQPLVGVPVFSGVGMRVLVYLVLMALGIPFMLWAIHRHGFDAQAVTLDGTKKLSIRHSLILIALGAGVAFLVYGANRWNWAYNALSAYYLALGVLFAALAGLDPNEAANAFVDGMKKMLMAGVLIALATAVAFILNEGQILDSIIHAMASRVGEDNSVVAAFGMFFLQLFTDVLLPSTSGQAAVTMPILAPLGQVAGVGPHTTVLAFLLGNGLTNMITPTSTGLLIFLATAEVGWLQWAKFIIPLWILFCFVAMGLLAVSVMTAG